MDFRQSLIILALHAFSVSSQNSVLLIGGRTRSVERLYLNNLTSFLVESNLPETDGQDGFQQYWSAGLINDSYVWFGLSFVYQNDKTYYLTKDGEVTVGPILQQQRNSATAAILNNVPIICGGQDPNGQSMKDCEMLIGNETTALRDLQCRRQYTAKLKGKMRKPRFEFALVPFEDGSMIAVGGRYTSMKTVERYNDGEWKSVSSMKQSRASHAAVRLDDRRLLVCGGYNVDSTALSTCEVFDQSTKRWSTAPAMNVARYAFGLVQSERRVFAIGGFDNDRNALSSVEILDLTGGADADWILREDVLSIARGNMGACLI